MEKSEIFEKIIFPAVNEHNLAINPERHLPNTIETKLIGHGASINSIELVGLIVTIEEQIYLTTGKQITLASEKAVSRSSSPFKTLETLSAYIAELLQEN